jgi:hypothetical protein
MNPHKLSERLWPIIFALLPIVLAAGTVIKWMGWGN